MKQDRFLTGILIGIGALVILALALYFVRQNNINYASDKTPEGVTQNYILALYKGNYERAYSYLADIESKPNLEQFKQYFTNSQSSVASASLRIAGSASINGNEATIPVVMTNTNNDLFAEFNQSSYIITLRLIQGNWEISEAPYPYWSWDWYQPQPTLLPATPVK